MDPNANLAEQRRIRVRVFAGKGTDADLDRLTELTQALDEWISNGGFLPDAWAAAFSTRTTYAQRTGRNMRNGAVAPERCTAPGCKGALVEDGLCAPCLKGYRG
jgi:hypothetical protein